MIYEILSGAIMMGCLVAGIFFTVFWKKTHDKLFQMFSLAFYLMAVERFVLGCLGKNSEPKIYFLRLAAFILILCAIIMKNRESVKED